MADINELIKKDYIDIVQISDLGYIEKLLIINEKYNNNNKENHLSNHFDINNQLILEYNNNLSVIIVEENETFYDINYKRNLSGWNRRKRIKDLKLLINYRMEHNFESFMINNFKSIYNIIDIKDINFNKLNINITIKYNDLFKNNNLNLLLLDKLNKNIKEYINSLILINIFNKYINNSEEYNMNCNHIFLNDFQLQNIIQYYNTEEELINNLFNKNKEIENEVDIIHKYIDIIQNVCQEEPKNNRYSHYRDNIASSNKIKSNISIRNNAGNYSGNKVYGRTIFINLLDNLINIYIGRKNLDYINNDIKYHILNMFCNLSNNHKMLKIYLERIEYNINQL